MKHNIGKVLSCGRHFQSRSLIARELRDALVRLPLRNSALRRRLNSDRGLKTSTESSLIQYPPPIETGDSPSELNFQVQTKKIH